MRSARDMCLRSGLSGCSCRFSRLPCGLVAAVAIWQDGPKGTGRVALGLCLAAATLGYPAYLGLRSFHAAIDRSGNDGSRRSAPVFTVGQGLRVRGDDEQGPGLFHQNGKRLAELQPVILDSNADEAFADVLKILKVLRWRVMSPLLQAGGPVSGMSMP